MFHFFLADTVSDLREEQIKSESDTPKHDTDSDLSENESVLHF